MSGMSNSPSPAPSRSATPNPANSRFTSQQNTAEDLLKSQTEGLVSLSDFRKRRLEAIERKEVARLGSPASGASTSHDRATTPQPAKKKMKKNATKGKLSFGLGDEEEDESSTSAVPTPRSMSRTPDSRALNEETESGEDAVLPKKKLGPRAGVSFVPKVRTKAALLREAQAREQMRKEYQITKEAVKATEMVIPFVFFDGTNIPGGTVRVKKGDHIWFFLDKARKVGAELGVGGDKGRREWARVSVDDLMLVRGEMIVPPHYEFYYFPSTNAVGFHGPMFNFSAERTSATPKTFNADDTIDPATYDPLARPDKKDAAPTIPDEELEGFKEDPTMTKVVDRRWYERNKHIFPASVWEEFDPSKDYSKGIRKDTEGNSFFFS